MKYSNAVENYFQDVIKKSWTWEKLTEEERKRFINMHVFDKIKGNDKTRIEWFNSIYHAFLVGLDYKAIGWREEKISDTLKIDLFVTATEIAELLSDAGVDDITDSSGYFVIKQLEDKKERTVDVYKSTGDGTQRPHYTIYCSFEDDNHAFYYTKDLSIEELHRVLKEISDFV